VNGVWNLGVNILGAFEFIALVVLDDVCVAELSIAAPVVVV
jgi:hypothetical protein